MQSNNPVLRNWIGSAQRTGHAQPGYAQPGYAPPGQPGFGQPQYDQPGYGTPYPTTHPGAPPRVTPMTLDDVVVRTVGLVGLTIVAAAASWLLLPDTSAVTGLALFGSMIGGLVLGLVIAFKRITNPFAISAYAVLQGVLLGVVSRWFESFYGGIVVQAVGATLAVFAGMAVLYKFQVLRATPMFAKVVMGALIGVVGVMLLDLVIGLFRGGGSGLGVRAGITGEVGWLPIAFSIVVVIVAALTFILDFDMIEQGTRAGVPQRFAWYCAFALLVGLIFLYWEILRLLSYLRR